MRIEPKGKLSISQRILKCTPLLVQGTTCRECRKPNLPSCPGARQDMPAWWWVVPWGWRPVPTTTAVPRPNRKLPSLPHAANFQIEVLPRAWAWQDMRLLLLRQAQGPHVHLAPSHRSRLKNHTLNGQRGHPELSNGLHSTRL